MARQEKRDLKWLKLAAYFADENSKDPSTKVGCVIVGPDNEIRTTGYNGLVRDIDDNVPARNERPTKYLWYEHAERNAIYNSSRCGIPLKGCTAYVNWHPCADCTRALIQTGIVRVVAYETPPELLDRWCDHIQVSDEMMGEAGVEYIEYPKS